MGLRKKYLLSCIFFIQLSFVVLAQQKEVGRPFIRNYSSKEYRTTPFNYGVVQDHRGLIYVANYAGILIYDGVEWQQIPVPNNYIFSLHQDILGRIFIGSNGEFGILKIDSLGGFYYSKISNKIKEKIDFKEVWNIKSVDTTVYFLTYNAVLKYDKGKIISIKPKIQFRFLFVADKEVYATEDSLGIFCLRNNEFKLIPQGDFFKKQFISGIIKQNDFLWIFRENDFCKYSIKNPNQKLEIVKIDFSETNKTPILKSVAKNDDGNFSLFTNLGLYIMSPSGKIIREISTENTILQNDIINNTHLDSEGGLWCALQNGVSRVMHSSPFSFWDSKNSNFKDAATRFIRHNGVLYMGTSNGVYYFKNNNFIKIEGSDGYIIGFESFKINNEELLLFASGNGIFQINNNKIKQIYNKNVLSILQLKKDPSKLLYVTSDQEIGLFTYSKGKWINEQSQKLDFQAKSLLEYKGNVWGRTSRQGVWSLNLSKDINLNEITLFDTISGLPSLTENYVFNISGRLLIGTSKGLYRYNDKGHFYPDSVFGKKFYNNPINIFILSEDALKNVWIHSSKEGYREISKAVLQRDGSYKIMPGLTQILDENKFNSIYSDKEGGIYMAGVDNVFKADIFNQSKPNHRKSTLIRKVLISPDSLIFNGNFYETKILNGDTLQFVTLKQDNKRNVIIPYEHNSLIFHYAFPSFDNIEKNLYSYRLEGFDDEWSKWSSETKKEYTNLREGTYTFCVKGKNIYGEEGEVAKYTFRILPPWYRTIWAYLFYLLIISIIFYLLLKLNSRRLKKANIRLEGIVKDRTAEIVKQKDEIEMANVLISEKNKIIVDSIEYAKTIQDAILPSEEHLKEIFKDSFVLFKPKDIVSGDFYWLHKSPNGKIFWATVDCTGHGVSGAFMTMIANSLLNEIIIENGEESTNIILDKLRDSVIKTLNRDNQTENEEKLRNGMDISLCIWDRNNNSLDFSGANLPILIIRNGELIEYKGDKQPIGIHKKMTPFNTHNIELMPGDRIYSFSDGYPDQMGGEEYQRFKLFRFRTLLLENHLLEMSYQKEILEKTFTEWKGDNDQIDDIVVLGFEI